MRKYTVTAAFGNTYSYDANGNQTSQTIGGVTSTFTYDYENCLTTISGGAGASFVYDADGNRVKSTADGVTTFYIAGVFEFIENGATDKMTTYYDGNAMRRSGYGIDDGVFYLLQDHLKSSSSFVNQSGDTLAINYYYPYGDNRGGAFSNLTTKRFTGQYHESSLPGGEGLSYYNARWYDAKLGRFLSADTLVPGLANPQAFNRYMYTLGNPLRFTDPTGHYSNEEIIQHFGCDTWGCVEANFNEGGPLEGAWGWLNVLQAAHDGDTVTSTMLTQMEGQMGSTNTSLLGTIRRGENGRIGVKLTTFVGADYSQSALDGTLDGDAFAQFARAGDVGIYGVKGGVTYMHNTQAVCYTGMQCATQALDAVSTGFSAVAAVCLGTVAGAPCAGAAGLVSTATGAAGTVLTGISAYQGEASWWDVGVGIVTTSIGGVGGTVGKGTVGVTSSLFQWWYDQ